MKGLLKNLTRVAYGLGGAAVMSVVTWVADGAIFTWRGAAAVAAGGIVGAMGTGKKKE